MPGNVPNTSILKSIDQVIQALNDLAANFQPSPATDLTTIEEGLTIIGDDFEAFNTLYETRSIAETVAQNTNFTALIGAINGLSLVCAPNINVQSATPTINLSCPPPVINIQGGGQTGTKLEDPPVSETDTPPVGQEPDPNIDNRKCKAANFVYDKIYSTLDLLRKSHADTTQTAILSGWIVLVGALLGSAIPAIGTVVGVVLGIATAIWIGAVDIAYILTALNNRHQDLVCALYNASGTTQAKDDFLTILDDEGVGGIAYYEFVGFFLLTDFLRILFQAVTIGGENSEALLDGYVASVNCALCSGCENIFIETGSVDGNTYYSYYNSEQNTHYLIFGVNTEAGYPNTNHCGPEEQLTMEFVNANFTLYEMRGSDMGLVYTSTTPRFDLCARRWSLLSSTAFTMVITNRVKC